MVNLLYELNNLDRVSRSGLYQYLYEDFESVATHSYKVTIIAYFIAKELGLDITKVLLMGIFHDMAEVRTGDSNWIQKPYITQDEEKALNDQLEGAPKPIREELTQIISEYKIRTSMESKVVKDADYIEYFMSMKILALKGNHEAQIRLEYETKDLKFLHTDEGKQLLNEVLDTDPNEWIRSNHHNTMRTYKSQVLHK